MVGYGRSGLAAAKFLQRHGATVFISEFKEQFEFETIESEIDDLEIEFGGHTEKSIKRRRNCGQSGCVNDDTHSEKGS